MVCDGLNWQLNLVKPERNMYVYMYVCKTKEPLLLRKSLLMLVSTWKTTKALCVWVDLKNTERASGFCFSSPKNDSESFFLAASQGDCSKNEKNVLKKIARSLGFEANLKLIAFELAGEDREWRENPVVSRLKIAFYVLHKRGWTGFSPCLENFAANSNAISFKRKVLYGHKNKGTN